MEGFYDTQHWIMILLLIPQASLLAKQRENKGAEASKHEEATGKSSTTDEASKIKAKDEKETSRSNTKEDNGTAEQDKAHEVASVSEG